MYNLFLLLVSLYAIEVFGGLSQAAAVLEGTTIRLLDDDDRLADTLQAVFELVEMMLFAQGG